MAFEGRLIFHAIGDWSPAQVTTESVPDARLQLPDVETLIENTWQQTLGNAGTKNLFDGPICRLNYWTASPELLRLSLSLTSYKVFVGTHLSGRSIFENYGPRVMANPLGVSCALETSDGWLLLGRRNQSVAYYPDRIHPFAGSMDPRANPTPNVFEEIHRELREEVGLQADQLIQTRCVGLVEDVLLHHPELIFTVRTSLARAAVENGLDISEHDHVEAFHIDRKAIEQRLHDPELTPVAMATIALWGQCRFGQTWFTAISD